VSTAISERKRDTSALCETSGPNWLNERKVRDSKRTKEGSGDGASFHVLLQRKRKVGGGIRLEESCRVKMGKSKRTLRTSKSDWRPTPSHGKRDRGVLTRQSKSA